MKKKVLLGLVIACACLYLALRHVNWEETKTAFEQVRWGYIVLTIFCMLGTHFFRARRWKVLLRPIREVPLWELFGINNIGFLAITLFPLRLGEFTRPIILKQRHQVPFVAGLATIAAERVFDALAASLILVFGFFVSPIGQHEIPFLHLEIHTMAYVALGFLAILCGFILLAVTNRTGALKLFTWMVQIFPKRFQEKLQTGFHHFFDGLLALPNFKTFFQLVVESLLVWLCMVMAYGLTFVAFDLHLHWGAPFVVMGIAAVGVMIPGAPAGVGTFQLFVQEALFLFAVSKSIGFAFSVVLQVVNLLYLFLAGLAFLPKLSTNFAGLYKEAAAASTQGTSEPV